MTAETDNDQDKKKTLSLSGKKLSIKKPADGGQIRQTFSHGRSRAVEVEVRKKRAEKGPGGGKDGQAPAGLTSAEWESRMNALKNAQEQAHVYEAELARKKGDLESLDRERKSREEEASRLEKEREEQRKQQAEELRLLAQAQSPVEETTHKGVPADMVAANKKARPAARKEVDEEESDGTSSKKAVSGRTEVRKVAPSAPAASSSAKRHKTRQQLHQISYEDAVRSEEGVGGRSFGARRAPKRRPQPVAQEARAAVREVIIPEAITVQELSNRMAIRGAEVVKFLMSMGMMTTITQSLDAETAELVVTEFGLIPKKVSMDDVVEGLGDVVVSEIDYVARAPVVTIMGHVDHGKTSLLDALRRTDVVSSEAGGITQHIGAYQVKDPKGRMVTFIDTPGHAAFTQMRLRGANVTDIVILVVAADDGIMEQTIEAIHHAKAAGVPILVAINKMDKPDANPERVRQALLQHELVVEELGGDILAVEVSAKKGTNLDKLLEVVMLQAEIMELKANPARAAKGIVIESKVEAGRGPVGTVLVQQGTLKVGDIFVAGSEWGRVRALIDYKGTRLEKGIPSQPVEILGFGGAPTPGEEFVVVENEARAREIADYRVHVRKEARAAQVRKSTMQTLMQGNQGGVPMKELALVIKSDVQGSVEAIINSLQKLGTEEVSVRFLHTGVGGINESDVSLAGASQGLVVGFNVRANPQARELSARDHVEIRYYSIIYDVLDDMKAMLGGLLAPTLREKYLGTADVRQVFNITKVGKVAGCYVTGGLVKRGARVRILRDNMVIYEGGLKTLKRFKDEIKEAKEGYECGITFEGSQDIREGDTIECFEVEEIARTLA